MIATEHVLQSFKRISLGVFPNSKISVLSLFCKRDFKTQEINAPGHRTVYLTVYPTHSLKTGYSCTQLVVHSRKYSLSYEGNKPHCRFNPEPSNRMERRGQVSKDGGTVPYAIMAARHPGIPLGIPPSSIHPKLGVRGRHKKFHRYAL